MLLKFLAADGPYGYARRHRVLEVICMVTLLLEIVWVSWTLVRGVRAAEQGVALMVMFSCGYLVADLLSGVAHWAGDTLGSETMPVFGRHVIHHFRYHHIDPKKLLRHDFIQTNGNACITSVLTLTPILLCLSPKPGFTFYATAVVASTLVWLFGTNQFHKWAHADKRPRVITWLQNFGIILSPKHHALHHAEPYDVNYCITHGHLNSLLTRTRFFRRLERMIGWVAPALLHGKHLGQAHDLPAQR
jgi:ubiquitin-conjugating enzyme E2 variant